MVKKELKFCRITNHIHTKIFDEGLIRTGNYLWIRVFNGEIYKANELLPVLKDGDFDIIQINLASFDIPLVNTLKNKLGANSRTKIVANNDYPIEQWQDHLKYTATLRRELEGADLLFGTEPFMVKALKEITGRQVYDIPHPTDIKRLKSLKQAGKSPCISVIWHRYDNISYIPYFVVRGHGLKTRIIGYQPKHDCNSETTRNLYDDLVPDSDYETYCKHLAESYLAFEPYSYHSYGRTTVDTAAFGIPVVGSSRLESMRRCYQYTSVDTWNVQKAREMIHRLIQDKDFYEFVSKTALEEVEHYNFDNSRKRLLHALYRETGDIRFMDESANHKTCQGKMYEINIQNNKYKRAELDSVSLCTTCMDWNKFLMLALPTWAQFPFQEVIIVDWGSKTPVMESIKNLKIDMNLKVIRVDYKKYFNLGKARNVGARECSGDYILFIDSDIKLNDDFRKDLVLDQNIFYRGHWKITGYSTNGSCLIANKAFAGINGYSEYMECWGAEDDDLYTRLTQEGSKEFIFKKNSMEHIEHTDELRLKNRNQKGYEKLRGRYENTKTLQWNQDSRQERVFASVYYMDGTAKEDVII